MTPMTNLIKITSLLNQPLATSSNLIYYMSKTEPIIRPKPRGVPWKPKVKASYTCCRCCGRYIKPSSCYQNSIYLAALPDSAKSYLVFRFLEKYGPFYSTRLRYSKRALVIALYFSVYLALSAVTSVAILKNIL